MFSLRLAVTCGFILLVLLGLAMPVESGSSTLYASLHVVRSPDQVEDADTCVDTIPLDTCIFGTVKKLYRKQRFVNITLVRHVGKKENCSDAEEEFRLQLEAKRTTPTPPTTTTTSSSFSGDGNKAAEILQPQGAAERTSAAAQHEELTEDPMHRLPIEDRIEHHKSRLMKNNFVTLAVPVSVGHDESVSPRMSVPLREFFALNRVVQDAGDARAQEEAEAEATLQNRFFGRALDTSALLSLTPLGSDMLSIVCEQPDQGAAAEQSSCRVTISPASTNKMTRAPHLEQKSQPREENDAATVLPMQSVSQPLAFTPLAHTFYCAAITTSIYEADALATLQFPRRDCRTSTSSTHKSDNNNNNNNNNDQAKTSALLENFAPRVVQFQLLDHPRGWYSVVVADGTYKVAEQKASVGQSTIIKISESPPARCHQSSLLSALYCTSCATTDEHLQRWMGPCPVNLVEHFLPNRLLNFELDPVCQPATCATMRVFESRNRCNQNLAAVLAERKSGKQQRQQQQQQPDHQEHAERLRMRERKQRGFDVEGNGKLLTLPCGDVHDRDSTGSYIHNVFMRCSLSSNEISQSNESSSATSRLLLFGEGSNKWIKSIIRIGGGAGNEEEEEAAAREQQRGDAASPPPRCVVAEKGLLAPKKDQFLHMMGIADCNTFGVRVSRKERHLRASDSDRFASGFCIPTKLGGPPNIEPTCVDWNQRLGQPAAAKAATMKDNVFLSTQLIIDIQVTRALSVGQFRRQRAKWESNFVDTIAAEAPPPPSPTHDRGMETTSSGDDDGSGNATASAHVNSDDETSHDNRGGMAFTWKTEDASAPFPALLSPQINFVEVSLLHPLFDSVPKTASRHRITVRFASWRDLVTAHSLSASQLRSLNVSSFAIEGLPREFPKSWISSEVSVRAAAPPPEVDCDDLLGEEFPPASAPCGKKFTLPPVQRKFVAKYDDKVWAHDAAPTRHGEQQQQQQMSVFRNWKIGDPVPAKHGNRRRPRRAPNGDANNVDNNIGGDGVKPSENNIEGGAEESHAVRDRNRARPRNKQAAIGGDEDLLASSFSIVFFGAVACVVAVIVCRRVFLRIASSASASKLKE